MSAVVAAVDLGATSGRVMLGRFAHHTVKLRTVHRFPNVPVETVDGLHWNILELYRNVVVGLRMAIRDEPELTSVGIDSWGVDYALLRGPRMISTPFTYRDARCARGVELVHATVSPDELYDRNGLQFLPFNTLYQLAAEDTGVSYADALLMIPDLIGYWLSGEQICEITNASTTGLLDLRTHRWDTALMTRLGLSPDVFKPVTEPGVVVGGLRDRVADEIGASGRGLVVTTVGSHDTASAVVGVPMEHTGTSAYISCGTWGLVGLEIDQPILTPESREANFTNEGGVDGTVRFLRNVMGLWLLSEAITSWERRGTRIDLPSVVAQAGAIAGPVSTFDVNDPRFLAPGDMPQRIADYCAEHGQRQPTGVAETVRSIVESLAEAFAATVETAAELAGRTVTEVHLVGGGSQNALLCQLVADRSGRRVLAGPVEATALGNVLVQGRAHGLVTGGLGDLRAVRDPTEHLVRYEPRG